MRILLFTFASTLLLAASLALQAQEKPALSYTALSDAAKKAGRLERYNDAETIGGVLELGDYILEYHVPASMRAYDVVPVRYRLRQPAGARRVAVEAVAFEDAKKAGDQAFYDLAIPGNMGVNIEYLGSVSADFDDENYIPLTPDGKAPPSPFPPYKRDPMVRSSNVRQARVIWFKFRITNTGDTILDPEGFGAAFAEPIIYKLDKDGKEEWSARPVNHAVRFLNYLYPGDSVELWTDFWCPRLGGEWSRGLVEGDYRIDFRLVYRFHKEYNYWVNIWNGAEFAKLEVPVKVTAKGGDEPVSAQLKMVDESEKMPGDFHTFEEFMTSFKIHQPVTEEAQVEETIYLQVAPWTENVVVKLIATDPRQIAVARVPVKITDENLRIKYNPKNVMVIKEGDREEPVFVVQSMPGMRTGFQLGPYPEEHMLADMEEMKAIGVNVLANTAGSWWAAELTGRRGVELHSACYKYWYDVLARKVGMKLMGWSLYPPSGVGWYVHGSALLGRQIEYSSIEGGYTGAGVHVDMGDPSIPEVIAAWTKFNYTRWGDMWFKTTDGRVPIDIEDTWGWMRDDINLRYKIGPLAIQKFRDWVKNKYGTIEKTNRAWGSNYPDFDAIDPEADQGIEGDGLTGTPVYNKPDHPFHDWSPAVNDWDVFRTELRMEIYRKATELIRQTIPGAELSLRTEGANLVIKGDPNSDSMHWRHVYFSQRRNAMVYDSWLKANVLHFHSDYTTLPYTEDEWRQAMREMVRDGVIPAYLPQFDHMRDILLNDHYGRNYQVHYNLDKPTKGMMVHLLMAAYPWWKATYEEGGAPGMIYSDYLCDGFATETQKREIKLLREYFGKMEK